MVAYTYVYIFWRTLYNGQQVKLKTTATTVGDKSLALNYLFKYNTFMSYGCLILYFPIQTKKRQRF